MLWDMLCPSFYAQVPGSLAVRDEGGARVLEMGSDARELRSSVWKGRSEEERGLA